MLIVAEGLVAPRRVHQQPREETIARIEDHEPEPLGVVEQQ
jgi:hypothetical protein